MARTKQKETPKRRPGRPRALTPELADRIVAFAQEGNYLRTAAQAHGIPKSTLYGWLSRAAEFDDADDATLAGLDDETALLVWFSDALKTAEANAEAEALRDVRRKPSHWQAQAWFLERRFQERFRRKDAVEHSGAIASVALSAEQAREEIESWQKAGQGVAAVAAGPEAVEAPADA